MLIPAARAASVTLPDWASVFRKMRIRSAVQPSWRTRQAIESTASAAASPQRRLSGDSRVGKSGVGLRGETGSSVAVSGEMFWICSIEEPVSQDFLLYKINVVVL